MDNPIPHTVHWADEHAASKLTDVISTAIRAGTTPAASLAVIHRGETVIHGQWGWQDPETRRPLDAHMLFDFASVTKLFTTTAFLRLVSAGKVTLDTPLHHVVPEFAAMTPRAMIDSYDPQARVLIPMPPEYAGRHIDPTVVTFRHLLTHTSGLPPWRKTYQLAAATPPPPPHLPDPVARDMRWARVLGAICALDFVGIPGDRVRYSDVGLMLLGEAIARLDGRGLAEAIRTPLAAHHLNSITFRPVASGAPYETIVPAELDPEWRQRRAWGEVHDENACGAGGIAGHAGLFGTALDLARFGQLWLNGAGDLGISPEIAQDAIREHVETDGMRRGLGFVLKAQEGANCGDHLSADTYGHTGFTGTSVWIDPQNDIVIALLTNRVYPGRDVPGIYEMRRDVHHAITGVLL